MKVTRYAKHIFYGIVIILIFCLTLWLLRPFHNDTTLNAYNTDPNEDGPIDITTNANQPKKFDVNDLPKVKCKHGKYVQLYNRDDPMHPKNRKSGSLDYIEDENVTIIEGYSTGYSILGGAYANPNSDPNQNYGFSISGPGSTAFNAWKNGQQGSVSADRCGKYCNSSNCCSALQQWADSNDLINIDFNQNRYDGGNHMVYCSAGDGSSQTTAIQYNTNTANGVNSCFSNQNNMVIQKCSTTGNTLNTYRNNVYDAGSFQNSITNAVNSGIFQVQGRNMGSDGNWDHAHYDIRGILNEMQQAWDNCNTINSQILNQAVNNCSNPNTSVTQDGNGNLQCGLPPLQQTAAKQINTALLSSTNPLVNDTANTATLNNNLAYAQQSNYGLTQLQTIQSNLSSYTTYANTVYNYCSNSNTRLDPNGVVLCAGDKYETAHNTCQFAMSLAQGASDISGNDNIVNYWNDLSNNLTYATHPKNNNTNNNVLSNVNEILDDANQYCTNQINKYNSWKVDEDIASNLPCIIERSIEPAWNSTITGYATDWSNAALTYLDSLNAELDQILADLSGSPHNALTISENSIQSAPYGTYPSITITGFPLNQTLNMVVPNGAPGPNGLDGNIPGDYGNKGNRGSQGTSGVTGIWEIPVQYSA